MADDQKKLLISLNDPLLHVYLTAADEEQRHLALEEVISVRARLTIDRVLRRYGGYEPTMTAEDAADLTAGISLRLVNKLNATLHSPDDAIRRFDDYVARLTYNAVNDLRRIRYPERNRLKRKLRFLLIRDSDFALWDSPFGHVSGLAPWRDATDVLDIQAVKLERGPVELHDAARPRAALMALFNFAGKPLYFESVTDTFARLWGINDAVPDRQETPVNRSPGQDVEYEIRETLQIVWQEINTLPPLQRAALLLNMRDAFGFNAAVLLPLTGVATFEELASAIGFPADELQSRWNDLPLSDEQIATVLGKTRQQVINLRKSARERLRRRLSRRHSPRKASAS